MPFFRPTARLHRPAEVADDPAVKLVTQGLFSIITAPSLEGQRLVTQAIHALQSERCYEIVCVVVHGVDFFNADVHTKEVLNTLMRQFCNELAQAKSPVRAAFILLFLRF